MATPSWSFNNGIITDAGNPGWSYDLKKQGVGAQNTDQALQMAMRNWQTKMVPGGWTNGVANVAALNPTSAGLTAARQAIGGAANTWGQGQQWNAGAMATRPDLAPNALLGQTAPNQPQGPPVSSRGTMANQIRAGVGGPTGANANVGQGFGPDGTPIAAGFGTPAGSRGAVASQLRTAQPNVLAGGANAPQTQPTVTPAGGPGPGGGIGGAINPATGQPYSAGALPPGAVRSVTGITGEPVFLDAQGNVVSGGAPATGPGAGRGYPSNWNANNAPGLNGETTFATNPATGASYEVSPMYQFQQKAGEKAINRSLRARGRYNSSVGVNALANFNNQLGAQEANQQYNRVVQQQQFGLQAALAQAAAAGASSGQLAQIYAQLGGQIGRGSEQYGMNIADLIAKYGLEQTRNILSQGTELGSLAGWRANQQVPLNTAGGANDAAMWERLATIGGQGFVDYMKNRR